MNTPTVENYLVYKGVERVELFSKMPRSEFDVPDNKYLLLEAG